VLSGGIVSSPYPASAGAGVGEVAVQRGLGEAGLGGDLPEAATLGPEQPGVLDLAGPVGQEAADATVPGFGGRAGVGGAFGGEGAFHLGEQRQEQECDAAHALGGGADRQRAGQRPDADAAPGEVVHEDWLAARLDDLDYGDIDGICAAARAYPLAGVKKDEMDKALGYFANNTPRMRNKWFRSRGLFAGSGAGEAGCKSVIGQRLKQSGMHWTVTGADAIAALRCQQASRPEDQACYATRNQTPAADQPNPLNDLDHLQDWRTPARMATPTGMSLPSPNITMQLEPRLSPLHRIPDANVGATAGAPVATSRCRWPCGSSRCEWGLSAAGCSDVAKVMDDLAE
jgi:hypothetical protein